MSQLPAHLAAKILDDVLAGHTASRIARDRQVPASIVAALAAQHGHPKASELRAARALYADMTGADPVEVTPRGMEAFKPLPEASRPVKNEPAPVVVQDAPVRAPSDRLLAEARELGLGKRVDRIEDLLTRLAADVDEARVARTLRRQIAEHESAIAALKAKLRDDAGDPDLVCAECGYAAKSANGLGVHRSRTHKVQVSA
jgi:hypothetical protein